MLQITTQAARLQPDDRVGLRIEGLVASEDGRGNLKAFELVGATGQGFLDQEAEERLAASAGLERRIVQDAVERIQNFAGVGGSLAMTATAPL